MLKLLMSQEKKGAITTIILENKTEMKLTTYADWQQVSIHNANKGTAWDTWRKRFNWWFQLLDHMVCVLLKSSLIQSINISLAKFRKDISPYEMPVTQILLIYEYRRNNTSFSFIPKLHSWCSLFEYPTNWWTSQVEQMNAHPIKLGLWRHGLPMKMTSQTDWIWTVNRKNKPHNLNTSKLKLYRLE